jgi:hypothetical protein
MAALMLTLAACSKTTTQEVAGEPDTAPRIDVQSDDIKALIQKRRDDMDRDAQTIESAPWFGTTGLTEDIERELPRYLRREFGKTLFEPGAIKAADLVYIGQFSQPPNIVHYWKINDGTAEDYYAYVEINANGDTSTGWGGKKPPQ